MLIIKICDERLCSNCSQNAKRFVGSQCSACYEYLWRTGLKRPRRLWDREREPLCKNPNCEIPLSLAASKRGLYCGLCDRYFRKYGKDRSGRLCRPAGKDHLGWCECGNVATKRLAVRIRRRKDELLLCSNCYNLEMETLY